MRHMYDAIIIGGGPTGLTLASYMPGRVLVVERRAVLGGCHRFDAETYDAFVEHGPRVYSGAYVNCRKVLSDAGIDWDAYFEPIYFSPELIDGKHWYEWLSLAEIAWLTFEYLIFALYDPDHGKRISVDTYCRQKGFSASSRAYLDRVCRFSDGGGAARYTLWEFVCGFDQHVTTFYAPRQPNDVLFDAWRDFIESRGSVDVMTNARVTRVSTGVVTLKTPDKKRATTFKTKKIIVCVPPVHAARLFRASGIHAPAFQEFARQSRYEKYWSVTFFGVSWGSSQKSTPWGIIAVQYPFDVVSAAASIFDVPGTTGASIDDLGTRYDEIAREIARQLGFPEDVRCAYETSPYSDQAFLFVKSHYAETEIVPGIDAVGCHNGKSTYGFTSMESAVQNALAYMNMPRTRGWYASDLVRLVFWVLLFVTLKFIFSE